MRIGLTHGILHSVPAQTGQIGQTATEQSHGWQKFKILAEDFD